VTPESIDFVMCTHLHVDHVGWNTQLQDGRWVPTFPKARYLFSKAEHDHWSGPAGKEGFNANVYEDSVLPVVAAGRADLVTGGEQIAGCLSVEPTPGHSIGHIAIKLLSGGQAAMFTGDIMHQPIQVYHPEWNSRFCEYPEQARQSRLKVLDFCADRDAMVFPAHFAGSFAGKILRQGERFSWEFA
jgi:glyoxylase-like metal-dependent hydrolase (beta-lactamase superfamily II)